MNAKLQFFLVLTLTFALVVSITGAASAVSGAISTTHNPGFVDDDGYIDQACLNGNGINCNNYLDKRDVWFSGLPVSAALGPGNYFFAVLVPGGQNNPNDGAPKNLSDDFDAYTNRTFSVNGKGKITAYSGTHHRDGNMLQLSPYADTTNPGGVYTLAVCSLDGKLNPGRVGKPGVSPRDCKYDAFKVKKSEPVCQPTVVTATFTNVTVGNSIEGMGMVAPNLNIDAKNTAIRIAAGVPPSLYVDHNGTTNGGIGPGGGFSDLIAQQQTEASLYTFTFATGTSVSNFALHMLDFGDLNPTLSATHYVNMTAYDKNGNEVAIHELNYTTPNDLTPNSSNLYGDLHITGDAATAVPGQPGNWTWNVSGTGIVKVILEFGAGFDPNIGFDTLTFTTECP